MRLILGDCLETLPTLEDASVDSVVTDPPYELGFMGKQWDASGIAYSVDLWKEVLRVLKPGGHLLAFGGTRTYHRMAVAIEDAGFEIRDSLHWIYGSGFPKSHNLKGEWDGWGTALKPAHEPLVLARKPFKGTVANNVLEHGTGAINIGASKIGTETLENPAAGNKPGGVSLHMSQRGMPEGVEARVVQGRWPSNIILSHSLECQQVAEMVFECVEDCPIFELDQMSGTLKSGKVKPGTVVKPNGGQTIGEWGEHPFTSNVIGDQGGASRFFYVAKASKKERNAGLDDLPKKPSGMVSETSGQHITRRDGGAPGPSANHHPTVKPVKLMQYLVRLITPPGGTVLDPFMGSGTTGIAAALEGFDFIGLEREQEYLEIAQARITHHQEQVA